MSFFCFCDHLISINFSSQETYKRNKPALYVYSLTSLYWNNFSIKTYLACVLINETSTVPLCDEEIDEKHAILRKVDGNVLL